MQRTKPRQRFRPTLPSRRGEPTWEIASLYPKQGDWSEEEYLALTETTNWMVELSDGRLEVLHLPDDAPRATSGEPTWEIAYLFPAQGDWSESEYLALDTNRLVELSDGCLEVHPVPLPFHQAIAFYLARVLADFVESHQLGRVLPAPMEVHLWKGKYREPDVAFLKTGRMRSLKEPPQGVDLAMEIVSGGYSARRRDYQLKRKEYARARISEYWIIDPEKHQIVVLRLVRGKYRVHGKFGAGETATSVLLAGFQVSVDAAFAAAEDE